MDDAKAARPEGPVQPLVGQLRERVLAKHGGPDGTMYGWSPTEGDSLMHKEAADEIERLDRAQAWANEEVIPRLEAEIERLRAALGEAERKVDRMTHFCQGLGIAFSTLANQEWPNAPHQPRGGRKAGTSAACDGWGSLPPKALSPICSVGVGSSLEDVRIYIEIIPRELRDIVGKPFKDVSCGGSAKNDSLGYKTLDDAIINAEHVGLCLLRHVEPENLLFIFGETVEALNYAPIVLPVPPPASNALTEPDGARHRQKRHRGDECQAKSRAIVFCKLIKGDLLQEFRRRKEEKCGEHAEHHEVTWRQLQRLKNGSDYFTEHSLSPNAPLQPRICRSEAKANTSAGSDGWASPSRPFKFLKIDTKPGETRLCLNSIEDYLAN